MEQGLLLAFIQILYIAGLFRTHFYTEQSRDQKKSLSDTAKSALLDLNLLHRSFWKPVLNDNPSGCAIRFFWGLFFAI